MLEHAAKKFSMFHCEINKPHIFPMLKIRKVSTSPKSCSSAAGLSSPSPCATWSESLRAFGTQTVTEGVEKRSIKRLLGNKEDKRPNQQHSELV